MKEPVNLVFFGASVTEQSEHHATKERTGYVNVFEEEMAEAAGYRVSRISAGSSDLMDAGVVYTERVIAQKPDICVIDWVTPSLTECDPRIVRQVYYRLMEHDILPVTVLLPRKDRVQKDIPIAVEMARISEEFDLPFFDALDYLGDIDLDTILRDTVHTNEAGAKAYAQVMQQILQKVEKRSKPFPPCVPPFQVLTVESPRKPPLIARNIDIRVRPAVSGPVEFCLVMEQRVGPYSPILDVEVASGAGDLESVETYPIFDPWCHRERQCIKRITNWQKTDDLSRIRLSAMDRTPGLVQKIDAPPVAPNERHLKPRGDLFIIADRIVPCSVEWS
ncbi:SGNH/GDSL hydrolase family protein [Salipiger aestuarii]|uniref:SGNH/GDSL hydrolase family protein n=1 Tax=Salipiger aestuarii TaxID=568098 RepID=UPI00123BB230|nr:SGNH/GDSL hydrolase family protein [Salipiger aestuarii]KAA8610001.1 hypothetical protein AL037_14180 [Salipiger aestuarii]